MADEITSPVETLDDIAAILGEGDETTEEASEESDEETTEEDSKEEISNSEEEESEDKLEETEEEEEDKDKKDEDEDELADTFQPFNKKKCLAKYPNLFKEFPALEAGYYANRAFREVFPTLQDAKDASARLEVLEKHVSALDEGSSATLFKDLKEQNPKNFNKVVNNYLEDLRQVDGDAYWHVISDTLEKAAISMFEAAKKNPDEEEAKAGMFAARAFKQFFFGDREISGKSEFKPADKEVSKVNEERKQWEAEKLSTFTTEIDSRVDVSLNSLIKANIDPKDQMSPFTKRQAIKEALSLTKRAIKADAQFQSLLKKMTEKAKETKYSVDSSNKIKSAYDSKAKAILPIILRKVRTEALSGTSGKKTETTRTTTLKPQQTSSSTGNDKGGNKMNRNLSTLDLLNS